MTQPTVRGRKLPLQDWEGDDFTPGAGGKYVTCADTAAGRMLAFTTNGRIDLDGRAIRARVSPPDPNGINLGQVQQAIHTIGGRKLIIPLGWTYNNVKTQLRWSKGMIGGGWYYKLPRAYRYQLSANFTHEMFFSHRSEATGNIYGYDPLNPDTTGYGKWYPEQIIYDFLDSIGYQVAYLPLEPL